MRDRAKILIGLFVFLIVALSPVWSGVLRGPAQRPELKLPDGETACVLPKEEMREKHMELLNLWRDQVVRAGVRSTVDAAGKPVRMSLTGTCLGCHKDRQGFCDACHNHLAVAPYCWDCHVEPPRTTVASVGLAEGRE